MARNPNKLSRREVWATFRRQLRRTFPDHADGIQILLDRGIAIILGEVGSEAAKSWLTDQVQQLPGVERVQNRLVVAAPLRPASSWDPFDELEMGLQLDPAWTPEDNEDEGTDIIRYPAIETKGLTAPGSRVSLIIDLRLHVDDQTTADPVQFSGLESDWKRVEIEVQVHSASLSFDENSNKGIIVVRRNEDSIPFTVSATINPKLSHDNFEVMAFFMHGTRYSGIARRNIVVDHAKVVTTNISASGVGQLTPSTAPPTTGTQSLTASAARGWASIGLRSRQPTLTCKIIRTAESDEQRYVWTSTTSVAVGPANRTNYMMLGEEPSRFAQSLRAQVTGLRPGDHENALRGFGQQIWEKTPPDFRALYWALRNEIGTDFPIQFITDEPHVPWELMQPIDETTDIEASHLFLDHPVSRWIASAEGYLWRQLPNGPIASFAPVYTVSEHELPFAADEAAWLEAELGAVACEPNRATFFDLLHNGWEHGSVSALHFAGHGSFDEAVSNGILMNDGWITDTEIGQNRNKLGVQHRSLAVINACDIGATAHSLGAMSGWAAALAKRKFGGFIAPLWPVSDNHASEVIRTTMRSLYRDHRTLGQAMRDGRIKGCRHSPTPFAYVCYGDVMARVSRK